MTKNASIIVVLALFLGLCLVSTGYALRNSKLAVTGKSYIGGAPSGGDNLCSASFSYAQTATPWSNRSVRSSIFNITFKNNSNEAYHSWQIRMNKSENTTLTTSHAMVTSDDNYIYMSSYSWNAEILPGASLTFEVQIDTDVEYEVLLDSLVITTCGRVNDSEEQEVISSGNASIVLGQQEVALDVEITLNEAGAWGGQVNLYTVAFVNNSNYNVTDYRATIYYGPYTLDSVYPCTKSEDLEKYLVYISNTSSGNAPLGIGERTEVTLVIRTADVTYMPDIVAAGLKKI